MRPTLHRGSPSSSLLTIVPFGGPLFVVLLVGTIVALPLAGVARAQGGAADPVDSAYQAAQQAYQRGRYQRVIQLLRPLVVPKTLINSREKLLSAHKLLALSYVFEKDIPAAESSFGAILAEDPKFELDPLVEAPAAVKVFRQYKARNAAMLAKIEQAQTEARKRELEQQKRRAEELRQLRELAKTGSTVLERRVLERPYWINFIPFGVGQFQNGHRTKGWILLTAQLTLATSSLALYLAHRFAFPDGRAGADDVASGNKSISEGLAVGQVVSGALFWAVAIYGVIDALVYHQPVSVKERRYQRKLGGLSLSPQLGPDRASLGLKFTF